MFFCYLLYFHRLFDTNKITFIYQKVPERKKVCQSLKDINKSAMGALGMVANNYHDFSPTLGGEHFVESESYDIPPWDYRIIETLEFVWPGRTSFSRSPFDYYDNKGQEKAVVSHAEDFGRRTALILMAVHLFVVTALLAQCGDVESNPGPKREPKPDKAKIMADKV